MDPKFYADAVNVVRDFDTAGWSVPAIPAANDWKALAILKLRKRMSPHLNLPAPQQFFHDSMDALARHPAFKSEAESALLNIDRDWRSLELDTLKAELKTVNAAEWGLTSSEQKQARLVAGIDRAPQGVDRPVFDQRREQAALELLIGAKSLAGYVSDLRRAAELRQKIEAKQAEIEALASDSEMQARIRAETVKAAKAERAHLSKRAAVEREAVTA